MIIRFDHHDHSSADRATCDDRTLSRVREPCEHRRRAASLAAKKRRIERAAEERLHDEAVALRAAMLYGDPPACDNAVALSA